MAALPAGIERLSAVARFLRDVDHPLAEWLSEVMSMVRTGATLEAALDLGHGYDGACRQQAQAAALEALVAAAPVRPTANARATWIARQAGAYEANAWCRDRASNVRPGGTNGHLFDLLMAGASLSARSIRRRLPELAKITGEVANISEG